MKNIIKSLMSLCINDLKLPNMYHSIANKKTYYPIYNIFAYFQFQEIFMTDFGVLQQFYSYFKSIMYS